MDPWIFFFIGFSNLHVSFVMDIEFFSNFLLDCTDSHINVLAQSQTDAVEEVLSFLPSLSFCILHPSTSVLAQCTHGAVGPWGTQSAIHSNRLVICKIDIACVEGSFSRSSEYALLTRRC